MHRWTACILPLQHLPHTRPHDALDDHILDSHVLDEHPCLFLFLRADDPTRDDCNGHLLRWHGNHHGLRVQVS